MKQRLGQCIRTVLVYVTIVLSVTLAPLAARAAPYAALVMDARTGDILYSTNADTRLYPASLTKMLTLYIAFEAIRKGEITLDTKVKVSARAANEAPSKLGLRAGQTIAMRYLIRAAAVKSANDCATAIGEAISGSEAEFAKRMNRTARALGMTSSTFKNANGLTRDGHLSTAHDMTILGRRLFYDFPEYYNIFSRRTTDAGLATVNNTNTRFLDAYRGADGIKTGYTGPAGFNLTASAERGNVRIIATIFGGTSTAMRNAKMAELLDLGFAKAPANARVQKPAAPVYADPETAPQIAALSRNGPENGEVDELNGTGKTIRMTGGIASSQRPKPRPGAPAPTPDPDMLMAMNDTIAAALAEATDAGPAAAKPQTAPTETVDLIGPSPRPAMAPAPVSGTEAAVALALAAAAPAAPVAEITAQSGVLPADLPFQLVSALPPGAIPALAPASANPALVPQGPAPALAAPATAANSTASPTPKRRPDMVLLASARPAEALPDEAPEIVTRLSTSAGRVWGITLGKFPSPSEAEKVLMKTALAESGTLSGALRKVVKRKTGYEAHFAGMDQEQADLACRRLQARAIQCFTLGP